MTADEEVTANHEVLHAVAYVAQGLDFNYLDLHE
jgi:hypothetical protein